ncbi:MAG: DUF2797 domain-containing protein [Asgard group archaeon]|nr:DUF2797 domain-containing protein [Asgard group archaeon]
MIIDKQIVQSRALFQEKEESLSVVPHLIRRYFWRFRGDIVEPYLLVDSHEGTSYTIKLTGKIFLTLGGKYCTNCGEKLPQNSYENVCGKCQEQLFYKYLRCIFDGPGTPFNKECTRESPACGSPRFASKCWSKHYLYIGIFGSIRKVGTSSLSRKEGKYYRLIEQGLDDAVVVQPFPSLKAVLAAEDHVSEELSIATKITTIEKLNQITEYTEDEEVLNWHAYAYKLRKIYPEKQISLIDIDDIWSYSFEPHQISYEPYPDKLEGEIVYMKGNLMVINPFDRATFQGINLNRLRGRAIYWDDESVGGKNGKV